MTDNINIGDDKDPMSADQCVLADQDVHVRRCRQLEQRILDFVAKTNGRVDDFQLTNQGESTDLCRIFCYALPVAATSARNAVLRIRFLDADTVELVARFLRQAVFLTSIELVGSFSTDLHILAKLLKGMADNTTQPLQKIKFTNVHSHDGDEPSVQRIASALDRIHSLREVHIMQCSDFIMTTICRGLQGHANLNSVNICSPRGEQVGKLLSSLPTLHTYTNTKHVFFDILESPPVTCAQIQSMKLTKISLQGTQKLRYFTNLRKLDARAFTGETDAMRDFCLALTELPFLEHLDIRSVPVDVPCIGYLARCSRLKHLACKSLDSLYRLLGQLTSLESLEISECLDDASFCHLLSLLETSCTSLRYLKISQSGQASQATATQFQTTLTANKTLTCLSLTCQDALLPVLVHAMDSDDCTLQRLCLEQIRCDVREFMHALPRNTKLQTLTLDFAYLASNYRAATSRTIVDVIPHLNPQLKHLDLRLLYVGMDPYDFANALGLNKSLTDVSVHTNAAVQVELDFACHLYTRRNRIRHMMIQRTTHVGTWPHVLHSLTPNPSPIFLTLQNEPDLFVVAPRRQSTMKGASD